jgi:cell division protein FtsW
LGGLVLAGLAGLFLIIKLEPYRARRLTTFLNPSLDPQGIGYHINQALLAIGSGGLFGYGYGLSRQKHNYLPESIGDSIFAVMAEELGFLRVLLVLGLFFAFALRALKIAGRAPDTFGKMLVIGIASIVGIQAIINIGSITGLLPLTGITLPFFSYGSSSLVVTLASVGIILNVSRSAKV